MIPMQARFLFLLCLIIGCSACKRDDSTVTPPPAPRKAVVAPVTTPALPLAAPPFLSQPIPTTVIEATNEALPIWRSFAKNRPALIIAANSPALFSVPAELHAEVDGLMKSADDKELRRRSSPDNPDPLLLPAMSLSVALEAGWFSQVLWIFPTKKLPEQLNLATFQQQLVAAQIASPDEAASFTQNQGSFSGIIRGLPFTAAPADALPPLEQSALLHIDVDYFKPLYHGEIKTPLYPLMIGLLNKIKAQGWKVAAATVALSNQSEELPLQTRFLGKDLATVLQDPQMLQETFPSQWERRGNALYLENFMQKEEIRKIYLEMTKEDPADPAVKFGLYNISRQLNKPEDALEYLREAVQLDNIYAREYLTLSDLAMEKKKPEKAVELLQLARNAQPTNPFILTQMMRTLLNAGHPEEAKALKPELAALNWSKIYYPEQGEEVDGLLSLLQ
jgi:hypothetical protein